MSKVIQIDKQGSKATVFLSGSLDEETTLSQGQLQGSTDVVFDFKNLQNINSCGIREWIGWVSPLTTTKITFRNCPKIIVDQINMIDGFLPKHAVVESFYVPYYSDETGEEKLVLFNLGKEYTEAGLKTPPAVTDSQGNAMELDVIEGKYFRFLGKREAAA